MSGDTLSQYLANGALIVNLPDGTQQTIAGIPPVPMDAATAQDAVWLPEGIGISNLSGSAGSYFLSDYTFENYNDTPHGPQIRIPLEEALRGFAVGEYRLTWQSIGSFSESITFEWDGKAITSVLDQ